MKTGIAFKLSLSAPRSIFVHAPDNTMHLQRLVRGAAQFAREQTPPWLLRWGTLPFAQDHLKPINFDGIIFFALTPSEKASIEKAEVAAVNVSSRNLPSRYPSVIPDNRIIGQLAADHFKAALYRNHAFVGPRDHSYAQERFEAMREALMPGHCSAFWAHDKVLGLEGYEHTNRELRAFLGSLPKNTGVFAANDIFARRLCENSLKAGRKVPDEIAILGVDAEEMISLSSPVSLSSIDINSYRMGYEAGRLLKQIFDGNQNLPNVTLIPPKAVVVGASTDHLATDDTLIAKTVEIIRQNACRGLTVEDLCEQVALSRRSLERRFRKAVNKSINEQITKVRIDRARALLEKSHLSVGEIADQCGFGSIYYFSRAFKSATGQGPREYRNSE